MDPWARPIRPIKHISPISTLKLLIELRVAFFADVRYSHLLFPAQVEMREEAGASKAVNAMALKSYKPKYIP